MISRLITTLVFLAFLVGVGGFAVLAAWDIPVTAMPVEKTLDNTRFLEKST